MTDLKPPLLIYIAGPYRAETTWKRDQNIQRARTWGLVVAKSGAYPVIPHSNTAHFDDEAPDTLWLSGTLELLRRCDGILLTPGWTHSSGSKAEYEEALKLGLPFLDAEGWDNRGGAHIREDIDEWLVKVADWKDFQRAFGKPVT